uniref:Uncharacterized protein n=1 Tax=Timema monikensis TaxID=170555 RepID=A0A7R9E1B0_9NEOP|nr:unnamed protein product [Timema monikensis]
MLQEINHNNKTRDNTVHNPLAAVLASEWEIPISLHEATSLKIALVGWRDWVWKTKGSERGRWRWVDVDETRASEGREKGLYLHNTCVVTMDQQVCDTLEQSMVT